MIEQKAFEHFSEIWKRVTDSRQPRPDAAPQRPQAPKKSRAVRFIAPCK